MASPPQVDPERIPAPAGVVGTPSGPVAGPWAANDSKDYPRLVFSAPRFETVAIADIIAPSVLEACQAILPTLVPPYVNQAAQDAVNALAVRRVGDTMTGALMLSPTIPTAAAMAATKQYVDTQVSTVVPEVPSVPIGASWLRQTGQWVQAGIGGTISGVTAGAGLTGGGVSGTVTLAIANQGVTNAMHALAPASTLKGNLTGSPASPTDLTVTQVMGMLGAAPLASPTFTGDPQVPTAPLNDNDQSIANTAFVTRAIAGLPMASYMPLAGGTFTGSVVLAADASAALNPVSLQQLQAGYYTQAQANARFLQLAGGNMTGALGLQTATGITMPPGDNSLNLATTAFVTSAVNLGAYLPISGGVLTGSLQINTSGTRRFLVNTGVVIGNTAPDPGQGSLTLNANAAAPPAVGVGTLLHAASADGTGCTAQFESFGGNTGFQMVSYGGTNAAKTPTSNNFGMMFNSWGYDGTALFTSSYMAMVQNGAASASNHGGLILFATVAQGSAGAAAERMRLQQGLNIGGTTDPGAGQLTTTGAGNGINLSGRLTGQAMALYADGDNFVVYSVALGGSIQTTSASGFTIAGATATKPGGGSWVAPSSREIKTDVQPYTNGLDAILALDPVAYHYSGAHGMPTDEEFIGLLAEDCQHMPELHGTMTVGQDDKATEVATIDPSALTFALINAVKELSARIAALEGGAA